MAIPGEIGHIGKTCEDCKKVLTAQVCVSGAGYYIGTYCDCGPYSRESIYYRTREEAERALASDKWVRRDTRYRG